MHWSWELCSRSFASVVKELDDDDDHTGTICDLVPIEDDISILDDTQQPLCSFHEESLALALNWNAMLCLLTVASLSLGFHASIHVCPPAVSPIWDTDRPRHSFFRMADFNMSLRRRSHRLRPLTTPLHNVPFRLLLQKTDIICDFREDTGQRHPQAAP
ncbi:hypothetical protein EDB85DRAFT_2150611 [Lactarius pseudohatsudake]|nr:hypothetical protein EDB85DRAFT_2150611 [Lactarius pseudohatsudake]